MKKLFTILVLTIVLLLGGRITCMATSVTTTAAVVPVSTTPSAPTILKAIPGDTKTSIYFTAPFDGGSPITDYEYKLNSGSWTSALTTSSPIVITGLTNYVSYSIAIRAVNVIGGGSEATVTTKTYVTPTPIAGNCPSGIAWSTVATGTSLPIRSSGIQNGLPGAVAFYDIATGKLSIDPKGWTISLFNFTYTWGSVNTTTNCNLDNGKGPLVFVDGYISSFPTCQTCSNGSACNVSGPTGAANIKNLPAGTWTLLTAARPRLAGTVSLVRVPTLATIGDSANIGSETGWFDKYWSFGNIIHSDSIANIQMGNWKVFGVSGNANRNILGYGDYKCTFQYTIDGVVGNMVGAVIPYNSAPANNAPTVTTEAVSSIAATTATGNGNITSLGVPNPTQYGVVWSTSANPTVALTTKTTQGAIAVTGPFTSSITGLTANTTYYVNAYATNTAGTSYGTEVSFTTLAVAPTTQASALVFSSVQTTQMTIGWTNGNGSKRAVFVKEGTGAITNPTDNTTYTASADWASKGTQLGSSGYYCVYNNNSNTFTLTGLSSATQYTVQIFEYNGPSLGEKYNITTATDNPKSQTSNSLIKYVDASKTDDSGDGFTWASAKKTLQAAIDLSVSGDQIWIKAGTYIPTVAAGGSGTRYNTFTLKEGVPIYGGFAGTETALTERVIKNNPTILSGDLNGDDNYTTSPWTNTIENAYHVIYMPGTLNLTSTVILDGLIISGGNANETLKGGLHGTYGGGMFFEGSPTTQNAIAVNNCILRNNYASSGGAIYTVIPPGGGYIAPIFTNCLMYSNKAVNGGAYAGSGFCQLYFNSCTFTENTAVTNGGAIYSIGYSMQFFYNSIFWNNTASVGKQFYIAFPAGKSSGGCNLTNCCYAYGANDVIVSPVDYTFLFNSTNGITNDPQFIDPTTADYRIFGTSPCVNAGVNDHNTETKDLRGETRVQNTTIDIGAYEWTSGTDPAANCQDAITVTNNNNSGAGSLRQALLDLCEGGTITLNLAVEWPANITITQNLTLDLHGYTVSNTGNYTALIDDGKAFGIKNTSSGGDFNAKIAFSATSSTLALYTASVLGSGFSVSATSAASGLLQIGDGTTTLSHTYTISDPKFNSKISKIVVKNSSTLILNPPFDKK